MNIIHWVWAVQGGAQDTIRVSPVIPPHEFRSASVPLLPLANHSLPITPCPVSVLADFILPHPMSPVLDSSNPLCCPCRTAHYRAAQLDSTLGLTWPSRKGNCNNLVRIPILTPKKLYFKFIKNNNNNKHLKRPLALTLLVRSRPVYPISACPKPNSPSSAIHSTSPFVSNLHPLLSLQG